jgi:hypothetical protein
MRASSSPSASVSFDSKAAGFRFAIKGRSWYAGVYISLAGYAVEKQWISRIPALPKIKIDEPAKRCHSLPPNTRAFWTLYMAR